MSIDDLKVHPAEHARLAYKLRNARVYVSAEGFHFTDYLDPVEEISPEIDASSLTASESSYIESQLQANLDKFKNQAGILARHLPLPGARILDIGCGGGLFLSLLKQQGAQVTGIELSDSRAHYARTKHDLEIHKIPIENDFWQKGHSGDFIRTLSVGLFNKSKEEQMKRALVAGCMVFFLFSHGCKTEHKVEVDVKPMQITID